MELWQIILGGVGGLGGIISGLQFLNTRKSDKKKGYAESESMVEEVYSKIIERLEKDICFRKSCENRIQ